MQKERKSYRDYDNLSSIPRHNEALSLGYIVASISAAIYVNSICPRDTTKSLACLIVRPTASRTYHDQEASSRRRTECQKEEDFGGESFFSNGFCYACSSPE